MKYTAEDVDRIVSKARARSTRYWVPETDGNHLEIEKVRERFDAIRIPPSVGEIEIESDIATVVNAEPGTHRVWFLTVPSTQRVFLEEDGSTFGVA